MTELLNRRNISKTERNAIINAWGNKCAYCKQQATSFEIDHIVPHADGGSCELENLCLACQQCNGTKSDTRLPKLYEGLLISVAVRKAERIRKLLTKRPPLRPKIPVATTNEAQSGITQKQYTARRNGMDALSKIFYLGLTEESYPSNIELWPGQVKCTSGPLDHSFFEQLGLTHREVVDGLASLVLEYRDEGGSGCDSLNFSCTTLAKDGSCVFAFHKSWAELKLYFWRLRNFSHEQVGVAA